MRTVERLVALLDHLGLAAAHLATQMPGDAADLAREKPRRIGGLVLCVPTRLDAAPFAALADRLLLVSGATGLTATTTLRAVDRLPAAKRHVLAAYAAEGWSDVAAERTDELAAAMTRFLAASSVQLAPCRLPAGEGAHAGLTYRIQGAGPPLVLLPFFLAPSQWTPAVPVLARDFTVIEVGGPHVGGIAALEDRARVPTYEAMFDTLAARMELAPAHRILDVGCGSGALDRRLASRLGPAARIDAVDLNAYFLSQAAALADAAGLGDRIRFAAGSALDLPFPDATFDAVFSITVLEECDADAAIAEMMRVARPGAPIGLVVRAIDLAQWWSLDLPPAIRAKAEVPPQSVGPGGAADASLYTRMRRAGLVDLVAFPWLVTLDRPDGPIWRYREDHVLSGLSRDETAIWQAARARALAAGLLLQSHPLHCAVARKPAVA